MKKWTVLLLGVVLIWMLLPGTKAQAEELIAPETSFVVLDDDTAVAWSLQQDLYVDLNGNYLTGTIVTNGYKVYGMDSFTDSYYSADAGVFRCVDENGKAVVPEAYVKTDIIPFTACISALPIPHWRLWTQVLASKLHFAAVTK